MLLCQTGRRKGAFQPAEAVFKKSVAENLWDMHPPFQIDGNFGMAAAVLEALAVRRKDRIKILGAIPEEWKQGKVQGQRLPGQISLSYEWKNGTLSSLEIYSGKEQEVLLVSKGVERKIRLKTRRKQSPVEENV